MGSGGMNRLARPDELELHPTIVGPGVERVASELQTVVDDDMPNNSLDSPSCSNMRTKRRAQRIVSTSMATNPRVH